MGGKSPRFFISHFIMVENHRFFNFSLYYGRELPLSFIISTYLVLRKSSD